MAWSGWRPCCRRTGPRPAEAIKQAVVADLKRFIGAQNVYDDITLVVAKQTWKAARTNHGTDIR